MSSCKIAVLSVFPEIIQQVLSCGVIKRASVLCLDLRDYAPKGRVDAPGFSPGPGMVFRADVLAEAVKDYKKTQPDAYVVHLSPRGTPLRTDKVKELAKRGNVLLIASRYEGADQRFLDNYVDEEISIGDYVLSGGELAAAVLADAMLRLDENVLQAAASADESFEDGLLEYPHYAPPHIFEGAEVPSVLKGGNHALIAQWRLEQSLAATYSRRPDLLLDYPLLQPLEHQNPFTKIKKQNNLLQRRVALLEQAIQEIKDVRKRTH